jgi:hypothetical protein
LTAPPLTKRHAEEAPAHAAARADELLAAGDVDGCAVWKRVVRAINELLDDRPPGEGEAVHRGLASQISRSQNVA